MADEPNTPATGTEPPAVQPDPAPAPATDPAPAEPATGTEPAGPAATADPAAAALEEAAKWKALARKHEDQNKATRSELDKIRAAQDADKAEREKQMNALAVAFGLKSEEVTPEQLAEKAQAERDAAQAQAATAAASKRAADVELAVLRAAYATGVNGNALLDSRAFVATVSGYDPAAADFAERVNEAITAAVTANPGYKASVTPTPPAAPLTAAPAAPAATVPRSGGEFNAAPGGSRQWTIEDVNAASPQEVAKAAADGLLRDFGWNPPAKRR